MNIPPKTKAQWKDIVTGKKTYTFSFLATKILLGRVVRNVSANPTPQNIQDGIDQLHSLFEKNSAIPAIQEDLKTIFG